MLSRYFVDVSVVVGAFVKGLRQISSFSSTYIMVNSHALEM